MKPNHLPAQHKAIISTEQQLVSVSCASAEAHVCICMCACVRVCTRVHWDKKIIETGGFGIRLSVCSSTPAPAPCPPPNPPPF